MILNISNYFHPALIPYFFDKTRENTAARFANFCSFFTEKRSHMSDSLAVELIIIEFSQSISADHADQSLESQYRHRPRISILKSLQIKTIVIERDLFSLWRRRRRHLDLGLPNILFSSDRIKKRVMMTRWINDFWFLLPRCFFGLMFGWTFARGGYQSYLILFLEMG